jgi:predicted Rossmann-fold nucleotide-binding protein
VTVLEAKRRTTGHFSRRRRVIAVIGSGVVADPCCSEVGRLIASLGFDLLTGGGRGVMEAVSRAFYETSPRQGIVIGVVPATVEPLEAVERRTTAPVEYEVPAGYPNEWVELAIYTHLPDSGPDGTLRSSRNHINVLSADAIVALPGREGTESEIWLAKQYGVPIIAYGEHHADAARVLSRATSIDEVRTFLVKHVRASSPPTT